MTTPSTTMSHSNKIAWPALIWIGLLHVGALLAFVPAFFSWDALLLCLVLHWVTGGLGITLTYHRLLTHRSFEVRPKWLEYVMTAIGASASEGGAIGWVADHRCHHAFSDEANDVHSPNRGFGWAHMFWWMTPDITSIHTEDYYKKWAPDLLKDPIHRWMDSYHILFPILGAVALTAIGGMPYLVWGFFVRTVLVLHSTWLVNSATHVWGYRSHETRDTSTNLWWVAIITYGEGWHNNHHAFQTSARHGMRWWEFDATYLTIRLMSMLGMASKIKLPKLTHAAPIISPERAAKQARKARKVKGGRPTDEQPELIGAGH
ncbi:acyl-CoA desaturase [Tundrisphaera lichenicola]|uniref:acyl-CoA desaturase n=1 Tax=Tundrisphaera lichenicola TaxID=2029860 RepID=UPI003EB8C9D2